jgi:D-3-phosphoglycerate dehydrogenase / 2-oxoglutarate reductase
MARFRIARVGRQQAPEVDVENQQLGRLEAEVVGVKGASDDELVAALSGFDGVLNYGGRFPAEVIKRLDTVWIIVQASTGYDMIDDEAATEAGIMVANLPFQCLHEVANSALGYILTLNRRLVDADRHVRAGGWDRFSFMPIGTIYGETLGLLGFGNISRAVARRGQALELKVIAHDPYVEPQIASAMGVELLPLDEVLKRSDYVSCHLPHNRHTRHMLSEAQFRLMKPTAFFVNTSRGKVVDEPALVKALQQKWIAGAGLDVFEQEPLPADSPLRKLDNVLLAGTSVGSAVNNRQQAIDQMAEALSSGRPSALVNRGVVSRRLVAR